ncbi:hypothetical protein ACT691_06485 [Vibrio metschnikovii]
MVNFRLLLFWSLLQLAANAGISVENEQGLFTIGGDVEYDLNFVDKDRSNQGTQDFSQSSRIFGADRSRT